MRAAAEAYFRGNPVQSVPASLRLWSLGKALPSINLGVNVMTEPYELLRELECYADRANAARAREAARARRKR